MRTLVMKFGGSAVGMTTGLTQVLSIVLYEHERWDRLLLVVSALEGVTDALIEASHLAELNMRRGYRRIVATLRTRHLALIDHLPLGPNEKSALAADIDRLLFDMLDQCQRISERTMTEGVRMETVDAIIGVGERLAARVVAALLRQNHLRGVAIDATDLIISDNAYGNATPNLPLTRERIARVLMPMLDRRIIPVVTGFIAATAAGKPTTLGRGGSDYTASILAACTDANEVWIWTDVNGMMSADPREQSQARVIEFLSYDEAAELAYFGARILHARMIAPLRDQQIPLRVRNVFKPQAIGTFISDAPSAAPSLPGIKAVTTIQGLGLSAARSGSLAEIARLVDEQMFAITGTRAEVMIAAQSASSSFVCFIIPTSAGPDGVHLIQQAVEAHLLDLNGLWTLRAVTVVSAIGSGLGDSQLSVKARLLDALDSISILALAQSAASVQFSVVVEPHEAERAAAQLHALIAAVPSQTSPQ